MPNRWKTPDQHESVREKISEQTELHSRPTQVRMGNLVQDRLLYFTPISCAYAPDTMLDCETRPWN